MPKLASFTQAKATAGVFKSFAEAPSKHSVTYFNDYRDNECGFLLRITRADKAANFGNNEEEISTTVKQRLAEWLASHADEIKQIVSSSAHEAITAYAGEIQKEAVEILTIANQS